MCFLIFRKSASIAKITQPFKVKTDLMTVLHYINTDWMIDCFYRCWTSTEHWGRQGLGRSLQLHSRKRSGSISAQRNRPCLCGRETPSDHLLWTPPTRQWDSGRQCHSDVLFQLQSRRWFGGQLQCHHRQHFRLRQVVLGRGHAEASQPIPRMYGAKEYVLPGKLPRGPFKSDAFECQTLLQGQLQLPGSKSGWLGSHFRAQRNEGSLPPWGHFHLLPTRCHTQG